MCTDCRADAGIGKPSRPDVLQHFFSAYVSKIEKEVLPLLEERDKSGVATVHNVNFEKSFRRAEALSRKFLERTSSAAKSALEGSGRWGRGGASSSSSPSSSPSSSSSSFSSSSFSSLTSCPSANLDAYSGEEEDNNPPVLFTLNMSDLRSLIAFMYNYQDLFTQIQLEYADSRFDDSRATLHRPNLLWPYLPVVIDAFVDGEDGARRGMQTVATTAVKEQIEKGTAAVDRSNVASLYFTYTPSDLWECLNAHSQIAGIGENNNERLQLKIIAAIVGVSAATVKEVTEDCMDRKKERDFEYVCAVVNDCSQHVESLDALLGQIASQPVKKRLEPVFEKITVQIYEAAQRCCDVLISIVFDDLREQITALFGKNHDLATIVATIHDYIEDFKSGLQPFYFVKLSSKFLTSTISVYLKRLSKQVEGRSGTGTRQNINGKVLEEDADSFRDCFKRYVGGTGLEQPLKVIEDVVRIMSCDKDELRSICEELATGRGELFASSLLECVKTATKLRTDSCGEGPKDTKDRKIMLGKAAAAIRESVERDKKASSSSFGTELGRDGEILTRAFPREKGRSVTSMLSSVVTGGGKRGSGKEKGGNEGDGGGGDGEDGGHVGGGSSGDNDGVLTPDDDFDEVEIMHFDRDKVKTNSGQMTKVGSRRRFTKIGAGSGKGGEGGGEINLDSLQLSGWLEKLSPSVVKSWQVRWFTLTTDGQNSSRGGQLSWHKKEDAPAQKSLDLEKILRPPEIRSTGRAVVKNVKSGEVKLRNINEDDARIWEEIIDCKVEEKHGGGKEQFVFVVEARDFEGKPREMLLRSDDVDEMLKWVNVLTALWQKFKGGEGGEEVQVEEKEKETIIPIHFAVVGSLKPGIGASFSSSSSSSQKSAPGASYDNFRGSGGGCEGEEEQEQEQEKRTGGRGRTLIASNSEVSTGNNIPTPAKCCICCTIL